MAGVSATMQVAGIAGQTAPAAITRANAATGTPFSEALAAAQSVTLHTVQRGETLSHIVKTQLANSGHTPTRAEIYAAVEKVATANGLANVNLIHPGQTLDLAVLSPQPATTATTPTPAQTPAAPPVTTTSPPAIMPLMKVAERAPSAAIAPSTAATPGQEMEGSFQATRTQHFSRRSAWSSYPAAQPAGGPAHTRDEPTWFELTAQVSLLDPRLAAATPRSNRAVTADTVKAAAAVTTANPWAPVLDVPGRITSTYGKRNDPFTGRPDFHDGIDIAADFGSRIRPVRDGVVTFSGWQPGYGKVVIVRHGNGLETVYGHNAANLVKAGDRVNAQSVLGLLGSTGRSTGPHLHFEVRRNGRSIDPMPYLQKEQLAAR